MQQAYSRRQPHRRIFRSSNSTKRHDRWFILLAMVPLTAGLAHGLSTMTPLQPSEPMQLSGGNSS
ncbi:MAG: hypothetical protein CBB79_08650 [Synechococcus sp. TMED19]|nr:MAG: hypothetical protein CBB79_08650 [Synechococcus sp. TMED19]